MLLLVLLLGAVLLGCIYHSSTRDVYTGATTAGYYYTMVCSPYTQHHHTRYYILMLLLRDVITVMYILHTTPSGCILGIRYVRTAGAALPTPWYYIHSIYYIHTYQVLHTGALLLGITYCGIPYWCITCCCATVVLHTMVYTTYSILPTEHTWWCTTYRAYIHDIHTYTAYTPYIPCAPYTAMIRYILGMLSPHPCIMVYYMIPYTLYTTYIPYSWYTWYTGHTHGIHRVWYLFSMMHVLRIHRDGRVHTYIPCYSM